MRAERLIVNDFTKEELETIVDAFNFIHGAPAWRNTEGWDDKLQEKIQSMIDNYCDHKPNSLGISCSPDNKVLYTVNKCSKCERFYFDDNQ